MTPDVTLYPAINLDSPLPAIYHGSVDSYLDSPLPAIYHGSIDSYLDSPLPAIYRGSVDSYLDSPLPAIYRGSVDSYLDSPLPAIYHGSVDSYLQAVDAKLTKISKDRYNERHLSFCRWAPGQAATCFVRSSGQSVGHK